MYSFYDSINGEKLIKANLMIIIMIIITIIKKNPSSKFLCRFAKSYYCNDPKGLSKQCRHKDQTALRGAV